MQSKIRIVTDSTADLLKDQLEQYHITMIPLEVRFGEEVYLDKEEITNEEFYEKLKVCKNLPSTSQISPGRFAETYLALAEEGVEDIISIHLSSDLSGTYQSSVIAAGMVADKVRVHTFDSRTATIGLALTVIMANKFVEEGLEISEIIPKLQDVIAKQDLYFLLDSLDNLAKGGRIGKASHLVGSLLNIKPILNLSKGVISDYEKIRGNRNGKALERLIEILISKIDSTKKTYCVVAYMEDRKSADYIVEKVKDKIDCDEYIYVQIGSVVGTHIGMGAVGMAYYQA